MTVTTRFTLTRRELLSAGAIALAGAACTKAAPPPPQPSPSPGSIDALKPGAIQLSLLQAQSELTTGKNLFSFGLTTQQGQLLLGGSPKVYASQDSAASGALGPWEATAYKFAADDVFKDNAPRSPLTGFYVAEVDIPVAGNWTLAAVAQLSSQTGVGVGIMKVVAIASVAPIGSKALSTPTPVGTTDAELKQICTRDPPDTMHSISLDRALKNGLPTVVCFATPLLCESRMCGPVTDEVYAAFQSTGKAKANFIHVEEFLPGPSLKPPEPTEENQSPAFKAWGLLTEPWTFVIDAKGIIRARFEGPVVEQEIEAALQPLLG